MVNNNSSGGAPLGPGNGTGAKKNMAKGLTWTGRAFIAYQGFSGYFDNRAEGKSRLSSLAHAAYDMVLPEFLGWKTQAGLALAGALPKMAIEGYDWLAKTSREYERGVMDQSPFRTNTFVDSEQIYTMRQAGMALAEQSKYALQQTLMGNEARYMHR